MAEDDRDARLGLGGWERTLHLALLVLLPALLFSGTLRNDYHLDSVYRIRENPELERLWPISRYFLDPATGSSLPQLEQYRPMLPVSLSLNRALSEALGLDPLVGYHLGNIALHLVLCLVLYAFFRELLDHWSGLAPGRARARLALSGALLYAVHPVAAVPVNYLCARDLLMMTIFLAGSLWVYARWRRLGGGRWRWPLIVGLMLLSLLSKTNAVVAPLLVLLFELLPARQSPWRWRTWARTIPAAACSVGFFLFTRMALGFSDAGQLLIDRSSRLEYPLSQLEVHLFYYARNALWPFHMRPMPLIETASGFLDPGVLAGLAFLLATLLAAWWLRRRAPVAAFCIGAYWALFLPTSSIMPLRSLAADYRQAPSLVFLCLLLALIAFRALRGRQRVTAAAVAVLWFGVTAWTSNGHWRDEASLWRQSVRRGGVALAHMNYARAVAAEEPEEAEGHYLKALELRPDHILAHINLGLHYIHHGRAEEGLALVRKGVALDSHRAMSHRWLAAALFQLGRATEAVAAISRAVELEPRNPQYHYWTAYYSQSAGEVRASLVPLQRLHELAPSYQDSLFLEGFALQSTGDPVQAIDRYQRFLEEQPDHVQARFNLAYALMEQGRDREAITHFLGTLERRPGYREVHRHLAGCYARVGEEKKAAEHLSLYEN